MNENKSHQHSYLKSIELEDEKNKITTLRELLESAKHILPDVTATNPHKGIPPLIRPRVARIIPGKITPDQNRFHEIFPKAFKKGKISHFMGSNSMSMMTIIGWTSVI